VAASTPHPSHCTFISAAAFLVFVLLLFFLFLIDITFWNWSNAGKEIDTRGRRRKGDVHLYWYEERLWGLNLWGMAYFKFPFSDWRLGLISTLMQKPESS
jgi:hypothetical protein